MIISTKDKVRLEGDAVVLINQIELILTAYKNGLLEAGETNDSAKEVILQAVENAFKYKDYYRYTTVDKDEEVLENELMLYLKQDLFEETLEKRTYSDLVEKYKIKENLKRIKR